MPACERSLNDWILVREHLPRMCPRDSLNRFGISLETSRVSSAFAFRFRRRLRFRLCLRLYRTNELFFKRNFSMEKLYRKRIQDAVPRAAHQTPKKVITRGFCRNFLSDNPLSLYEVFAKNASRHAPARFTLHTLTQESISPY